MDREELQQAVTLLRVGKAQECYALTERALAKNSDDLLALAYRGIARGNLDDAQGAIEDLRAAADRAQMAEDRSVEAFASQYLGNKLVDTGDHEGGLRYLERAAELGLGDEGLFTGICQAAYKVGDAEKAREWGEKALIAKDALAKCAPEHQVDPHRRKPFDPSARERNVIAYSLFGEDEFYHQCAITNARMLPFVYPEFTPRFFCSASIPKSVVKLLTQAGAQVMLSKQEKGPKYAGLFWRFLAFDDPGVDCVLVRDVDSPVLPRERVAVEHWLAGDKPFHVMRDHVQHTAPILAGMWGGFTGLLPRLGPIIDGYVGGDTGRFSDQIFLRKYVWPRIRDAALVMDSTYSLHGSVDFPPEIARTERGHVGNGWSRKVMASPS